MGGGGLDIGGKNSMNSILCEKKGSESKKLKIDQLRSEKKEMR